LPVSGEACIESLLTLEPCVVAEKLFFGRF
jgi:hypothetical protein